ncbi:MAG: triose-phosphate isomerase [Flavobacteriales bacterium]
MRRKIVAGNWKMNNDLFEGNKLCGDLKEIMSKKPIDNVDIILGVPYTHLKETSQLMDGFARVAAQDCSSHQKGAYTGEVSCSMIHSTGANYVIVGHSERRMYHNELSSDLLKKIKSALDNNLKVIFCCGESLDQRESNLHFGHIERQLEESLFSLSATEMKNIIIAYEPIWAIGTGVTASSDQAQEMHQYIRLLIKNNYSQEIADGCSILYGGSCKPNNASEIFSKKDVDGGLIGGASLNAKDFYHIIHSF